VTCFPSPPPAQSFILAIVAQEISGRPASGKLTYGWVRAEVLSALISTMFIVFLSAVLAYEAVHRIIDYSKGEGEEVNGKVMTIVAAIGLIVNIILLWILGDEHGGHGHDHGHHEHGPEQQEALAHGASINNADPERGNALHKHSHEHSHSSSHHSHTEEESSSGEEDEEEGAAYGTFSQQGVQGHSNQGVVHKKKIININVSAAFLHAVSDLIQSVGVLLAGIVIWVKPEWKLADPISTLFFTMLVVNSTRYLLSHATTILLEGVPDDVNYEQLKVKLRAIEGVTDVHCLHIWSLTLGRTIVTAHIKAVDPDFALGQAHTVLEQMGIFHSTIQVQKDACVNEACTHACVSSASRCC
jgi:zinc transporter 2